MDYFHSGQGDQRLVKARLRAGLYFCALSWLVVSCSHASYLSSPSSPISAPTNKPLLVATSTSTAITHPIATQITTATAQAVYSTATNSPNLSATPELPPVLKGRKAAFVANEDNNLYVFDVNLQKSTRITSDSSVRIVGDWSWSPDGHRLAFASRLSGVYQLFIVNWDGSDLKKIDFNLYGGADRSNPSWSPDGKYLAFVQSDGVAEAHIYLINLSDYKTRFLTNGRVPAWSPDGKNILFVQKKVPFGDGDIYSIEADGSKQYLLTRGVLANVPTWSPDGKVIAFWGYPSDDKQIDNPGIYVVYPDGSGLHRIANTTLFTKPNWVDNQHISFVQDDNSLQLFDLNGVNPETITGLPSGLSFVDLAWQPISRP